MRGFGILILLGVAAALLLSTRGVRAAITSSGSYEVIPPWLGDDMMPAANEEFVPGPIQIPPEDYAMTNADMNVNAFLAMIRAVEPDQRDPYKSLVGGGFASDLRDHPANIGWPGIKLAGGLKATSAGAYQITRTTWNTYVQPALHLPDFSPASQDAAGLYILQNKRGARAFAAVVEGRFTDALAAYRLEWEAFDRMLKGQYPISVDQARAIYQEAGGSVA